MKPSMQNFIFKNPTEILFGRGMIASTLAKPPKRFAPVLPNARRCSASMAT